MLWYNTVLIPRHVFIILHIILDTALPNSSHFPCINEACNGPPPIFFAVYFRAEKSFSKAPAGSRSRASIFSSQKLFLFPLWWLSFPGNGDDHDLVSNFLFGRGMLQPSTTQ